VFAEEIAAFDVEEGAVEEFEGRRGVAGAGTETWVCISCALSHAWWGRERTVDVLGEGDEAGLLASELCQSIVTRIRLHVQCHMASIAVELPH